MKQQNLRDQQINSHLFLVDPIAGFYARKTRQDKDDLVQVGRLGLIRAAILFEPLKGRNFEAFARPHIRGAILHYLRDSIGLVRIPRRVQEKAQAQLRTQPAPRQAEPQPCSNEALDLQAYQTQATWIPLEESEVWASPSSRDNVWTGLANREQTDVLWQQWNQLPHLIQACLRAVVLDGLSLRSTALRLETSPMTVQRHVKRGLSMLAVGCRRAGLEASQIISSGQSDCRVQSGPQEF